MVAFLDFVVKETTDHKNNLINGLFALKLSKKEILLRFLDPLGFFNMAASGHFGFLALSKFTQISQTDEGAYFVASTLKYQNQPLNFANQRLVTESMIFNLLSYICQFSDCLCFVTE